MTRGDEMEKNLKCPKCIQNSIEMREEVDLFGNDVEWYFCRLCEWDKKIVLWGSAKNEKDTR
jgi:hypothetical protein